MPAHRKKKKHKKKKKKHKASLESNANSAINSESNSPSNSNRKKKTKRKSCKKPKDPHKPKRSQSSYFLFSNEVRPSLQQQHSDKSITEIAKLIGSQWKQLSSQQKKPYTDKAKLLREQYNQALIQYKESENYKAFQQKLKQWKQNQNENKNKTKKSKKKKHKKKKSKKKVKIRSKKRKRKKKEINYSSDSSLSSLSSILCDNPLIHPFTTPKSPPKTRRKSSSNNKNDSDDLSNYFDENRQYLSIANAIRNTSCGIEMPSKIKEREEKIKKLNENRNNINESYESNVLENESEEENKEDIFMCRMCEKSCLSLNELNLHEKKLHTKQCKHCALRFRTESLLQQHIYNKHDLFSENVNDNCMRVDENGNFKLNQSISTQRFVYKQSRWRQQERIKHKINQITDIVVVDESKVNHNTEKRLKNRVTVHSFLKKKRHNMGNSCVWSKEETQRFYQVLSYTALNFVFMEVLYNKAITKQEENVKVKVKVKVDGDNDKDKDDSDSDDDSECEDKKVLKWRYRDAKALKKKYYREEKINFERISDIVRNVKFQMNMSDVIDELVKKNDFKLKDEEYFVDSDVEIVDNGVGDGVGDVDGVDEDIFDPLIAFKEEIEEDARYEREVKKKKMEKLEDFRNERNESMANALAKFKKEQQEYKKYKKIKEQSATPMAIPIATPTAINNNNVINEVNDSNINININNRDEMNEDGDGDGDSDSDSGDFDPFGILSDNNDSDCGVNGYDSDRSVTKNKKSNNNGSNVYKKSNNNGGNHDDEYDDYDEYNGGYDDVQDFDMDGDPFA